MKDRDKREEMLSIYRPLILTEVSKYLRKLGNLADSMADDLEQAGSLGLLSALSSFDSSKSPVLIPYLRRGIDMAIMKELTDNLRTIRQPREVVKRARALKRAMNAKPDAGEEELMALSGLSASEMKSARLGLDAELAEVVEDVRLKALKAGLCGLVVFGLDAEGDVLALDETVVAALKLVLEHLRILDAQTVVGVAAQGNDDAVAVRLLVGGGVDE